MDKLDKLEITYNIPDRKQDISLEQWMKFEKLATDNEVDADFLQKKMLEIFCGIDFQHSSKLKQTDVNEIIYFLEKVLGEKSSFHQKFEFQGVKYGIIPDFDKHITSGELIDASKYLENKDYPRLLSILYRPITLEKAGMYQIEPYLGTHTDFRALRYDIFEGCISFFLTIYEQLIAHTLKYTLLKMKKMKNLPPTFHEKVNSLLNGAATPSLFSFSAGEILPEQEQYMK